MSASGIKPKICPICRQAFEDDDNIVKVREKGADGINAASVKKGDTVSVSAGDEVHSDCRKRYTNPKMLSLELGKKLDSANVLKRSSTRVYDGPFDSQNDCLFCGHRVLSSEKEVSYVKTDAFVKTILECCESRSDDWGFKVRGRIEYYGCDLHAADCLYHHMCSANFRSGKDIPLQFRTEPHVKRRKAGRPKNERQEQAFLQVCQYLETNDEEQFTVSSLSEKMNEFLSDSNSSAYDNYYLKSKLRERYGDGIYFAEGDGLHDIVTMREKTSQILRSYFKQINQENDEESQKRKIIETAARLIKSDTKSNVPSVTNEYPSTQSLKLDSALSYIPDSLRCLLNSLFVGKDTRRKVASIGQAVIQAIRPRAVLAPLQVGLAVQAHHVYRSKFLVDSLHEMGFASSYGEVLRFEKNAASHVAPDMLGKDIDLLGMTLLFAGDNVDHNILTIDGKGTFHGMGIIAALTPGRQATHTNPRLDMSEVKLADLSKIPIVEYRYSKHARTSVLFQELPKLLDCDRRVDILWELSLNYTKATPNWQGMMHIIHQGREHTGESSITYLPMIDMYSGDATCILSTLEYICNLALKHSVPPIITFDQPLYWKAAAIITDAPQNSNLKQVVLLLGCFHTFMNLLGAIGTLMGGTGLKDILQLVYGENSITHMMTGKSVQRAFRGHLLVDKCLNQLIVTEMVDNNPDLAPVLNQLEEMYSSLLTGKATLEDVVASDTISELDNTLNKRKTELQSRSKTSQLWLNYQGMLKTARSLIKADRTGSWLMHLRAVSDCLPVFAAAGHFNYLKSCHFYVQDMCQLEMKHPDVFRKFNQGYHVIRRSNQFWAGLSSDLVIEQTLMRSLKGRGGLTHGSGMMEEQRSLWTLSAPITSQYNNAMQEFTDMIYTTGEQHKESTEARIQRDALDLQKIHSKLVTCTPFSANPLLRNVVTGVVAKEDVNVHDFESIGNKIMEKMIGQPAFTCTFKRRDKATTLGDVYAIKVVPDRTIDPALLFERFLVVSKSGDLSLEEVMSYELSPFPPSLFEAPNVLRKADKPQLAHAIADYVSNSSSQPNQSDIPKTDRYVLDGGSLLHRLPWKKGDSYGAIAKSYADFTVRKYGLATVVFDGYGGPSIKDNTHQRRGQNTQPIISFTADTEFSGKQENFLSRDQNKESMINLIGAELMKRGCRVINAAGDADVDIAIAAVESSRTCSTTLIGEDTDILVLLLYYSTSDNEGLYFRSDKDSKQNPVYDINCLKKALGDDVCRQLLFVHAFTGCDSTSRIFGIGKKSVFQKLVKGEPTIRSCADVFTLPDQTGDTLVDFGSRVMVVLFGGKCTDSLASVRYKVFSKKVISAKSFVTPERLPPTASSTTFHCLRVYYQIMVWIKGEKYMDVSEWGWKLDNDQLVPSMSEMDPAPEKLLKMIHCNCKSGCKTLRCSCRGYGLPCSHACGSCQNDNCDNPHNLQLVDDEEEFDPPDME